MQPPGTIKGIISVYANVDGTGQVVGLVVVEEITISILNVDRTIFDPVQPVAEVDELEVYHLLTAI